MLPFYPISIQVVKYFFLFSPIFSKILEILHILTIKNWGGNHLPILCGFPSNGMDKTG